MMTMRRAIRRTIRRERGSDDWEDYDEAAALEDFEVVIAQGGDRAISDVYYDPGEQ